MEKEINYSKSKKYKVWLTLSVLILALATGILGIYVYENSPQGRIKKALEIGIKYLDELDYESARVYFIEALSIDSTILLAHQGLIRVNVELKDYEEAINQYNEAISTVAENDKEELKKAVVEAMQKVGENAIASKDYDTAIYCYEQINIIYDSVDVTETQLVSLGKKMCNIYMILADNAMSEGKYEEAVVYCNKVLDINGVYSDAANMLYDIYIIFADRAKEAGCYDDAIMYCHEALAIDAQGVEAISRIVDSYLVLAKNAEKASSYDKAEEYYNIILEYIPGNQEVLNNMARLEHKK